MSHLFRFALSRALHQCKSEMHTGYRLAGFLQSDDEKFTVYLNVAKVEDASDPRRQGLSRSHLLRTLDNKEILKILLILSKKKSL